MPRLKPKKRLSTQNIVEQAVKDCLQNAEENFSEIFNRLNKRRWSVSESVTHLHSAAGSFVKVPGLEVKIDCNGRPIRVFLRQAAERAVGTIAGFTGGYVQIIGSGNTTMLGALAIQRNGAPVHGNLLGGSANYTAATATPEADCYNAYYPPGCLDFTDLEPPIGTNTYEVYVFAGPGGQLLMVDVELVALEHL